MAIHTYKITRKNEWKHIRSILFFALTTIIAGPIIYRFREPEGSIVDIVPYLIIGAVVVSLPGLIIHFTYYSMNEKMVMEYDDFNREITIVDERKKMRTTFSFDDISKVFHYMTTPMVEKRMHWFPWDSYNYSKIYLKDGQNFIITCLMTYRMELPIGDKYEPVNKFFPYPG